MATETLDGTAAQRYEAGLLERLFASNQFLGVLFMLPAATILLMFLAYPLGLGVWLGMTDTTIGRRGVRAGELPLAAIRWLSVYNTFHRRGS